MRRKFIVPLLITFILFLQITANAAGAVWTPEEKMAQLTKPAVVRIYSYYWATWTISSVKINTYYGSMGTGAIINPDGYIVTNAHVVEAYKHDRSQKWQNLAWSLVKTLVNKYKLTQSQAISLINAGTAKISQISDVNVVVTPGGEELPFDLKQIGNPSGLKDGKDVAVIKIEGRNYPTVKLGNSDKIRTGERIYVAGYPSDGDLGSWGTRRSYLEWTWTNGSISSDRKTSSQGAPLIQISAESIKPGNSGGPVLNGDGYVIGLITFGTTGGPHWAMASKTVLEYVRQAGANNEESLTDKAYKNGLTFYWEGYYAKALPKFEEVKRLYPKHSEVESLIVDCQKNITEGKNKLYWPDYYIHIGAGLVIVIGLMSIGIYLWMKRKKNNSISTNNNNQNENG